MRLPSLPTLSVIEHLNSIYFDEVWNSVSDYGRVNFQLYKANVRLQRGAVPVDLSVVGLPTTDKVYAVYRVAAHVFGRFVGLPAHTWITDSDVLTNNAVSLTTYTAGGRVIPAGCVHIQYEPVKGIVLLAIEQVYTSKCTGASLPDLYMTINRDVTSKTPVIATTYQISTTLGAAVTPQMVTQAITNAVTHYPAGTVVYVNGWTYDPTNVPTLVVGDVIEIVSDPDIVGYCDLPVDDNQTGYYSNLYGEYREALHIPKVLNPNNYLITHETLSVYVFDAVTHKGVYGHRVDPNGIQSVTHNDFSMSRSVLQAFQNSLGAQGVSVRIYVRYSAKPIVLGGDVNRMQDLYTQSDAEIKKQLAGLSTQQILEWKAANLEQSSYLKLLYKFAGFTPNVALAQFSAAMGYYDVASTLSQAMHYYTYQGGEVQIIKPVRLFGYACKVIVYVDGRKLPASAVNLSNFDGNSFLLGFKANNYVAIGSRIGVYVVEGNDRTPIVWTPNVVNDTITLDSEDYQVVKIVSYPQPQGVWQGQVTKGYQTIPLSPGDYHVTVNPSNTVNFRASAPHFGETLYLLPICGLTTEIYPLDDLLSAKEPIVFPLTMKDAAGIIFPLIGYKALELYINGYRLIEGLDYTISQTLGASDDVLQTLLEVSNCDYFDLINLGNILEVVVHGDTVASSDAGYVISNMMHRTKPPMVWSASCGRAYAHGRLIEHVSESGNTLVSTQSIDDGSPYLLEWSLPYGVSKLMQNLVVTSDINLRTRIDVVLGYIAPLYPPMVLVNHLYALYSPYLAQIITDVASGALIITNEPKNDMFLRQFAQYRQLFVNDPVVGSLNPLIDQRFVTLAAHYANFAVSDPTMMILVQRLISLVLTPSQLSIEEVLV